jgi:membrane protease YdiL (CAAX protease family)
VRVRFVQFFRNISSSTFRPELMLLTGSAIGASIAYALQTVPEIQAMLRHVGFYGFPGIGAITSGVIFGVTGTAINVWINHLLRRYGLNAIERPLFFVWLLPILSIVPPLSEEIIFRGILQTNFGIVIASILFAVVHLDGRSIWNVITSKLFMGFWLGLSLLYSGNLWTPIIVHFINNAWCFSYSSLRGQALKQVALLSLAGKWPEALAAADLIPPSQMTAYALRCRADIYINLQQYDKAIDDATNAIALYDYLSYAVRGNAHLKLGQLDQAFCDLETALKKWPRVAYVRRIAGLLALEQMRYPDALLSFTKAYRFSKSAIDLSNTAVVHIKMGEREKAIRACEQAIKKDKRCTAAVKNLEVAKLLSPQTAQDAQFKE